MERAGCAGKGEMLSSSLQQELPAALSPEPGNICKGGKVSSSEIQFSLMINHLFVMQKTVHKKNLKTSAMA